MICPHPACITQLQRTANGNLQHGVNAQLRRRSPRRANPDHPGSAMTLPEIHVPWSYHPPARGVLMTNRTMGDSVALADIPLHVQVAAVDVNGNNAVTEAKLQARFPHDRYGWCWIDVNGSAPSASVRDWETGDKAGSLEQWVIDHNRHSGKRDAVIYCNRSTVPEVRQLTGSQVLGVDYGLWISTLDGTVVSGTGIVACQDKGTSLTGGHWDSSIVYAPSLWLPAVPAAPKPTRIPAEPKSIVVRAVGGTGFTIEWPPVVGATEYRVRVTYQGREVQEHMPTGTVIAIAGLVWDHTYTVHVSAGNAAGWSAETNGPEIRTTR